MIELSGGWTSLQHFSLIWRIFILRSSLSSTHPDDFCTLPYLSHLFLFISFVSIWLLNITEIEKLCDVFSQKTFQIEAYLCVREPKRKGRRTLKTFLITELIGATYLIQNAQWLANCLQTDVALLVLSLCMRHLSGQKKVKANNSWERCEVEAGSMCGGEMCIEKASADEWKNLFFAAFVQWLCNEWVSSCTHIRYETSHRWASQRYWCIYCTFCCFQWSGVLYTGLIPVLFSFSI